MQNLVAGTSAQNSLLQARLDELEDRSRRDNLIFHGLPDVKESWEETERKIVTEIKSVIVSFSAESIHRAHRLGSLSQNRCRPIIVKFKDTKTKDKVFSTRSQFKEKDIGITEDFSHATRITRKKLTDFAKSLPESPQFNLRYIKVFVNKKCYMFNPNTDQIFEVERPGKSSENNNEQPRVAS